MTVKPSCRRRSSECRRTRCAISMEGTRVKLVVRAFERMPGGHSSFLERLTNYHRRVAVRAGLPRWPQTTAEEQFVRALAVDRDERQPTARSAKSESEATPGVTRPPWYFGFVGTTYVDLLVRCEHGEQATLRFRGPEQTVDVPIEIPRTVWPPLPGQPQNLASFAWARVRRTLAVKITDDNELRGSDVLLVDYDAWDGITDPDVFNDIELDVHGASEVDIVAATVVLNDTVLMSYSFPEPLRATQLKSASLKSALWFGTMRSLVHPWPKNPVADEIQIPREVFQPILEDPAVQSNPLLVQAASTLGQAWHERYGTSWPRDEESNEWDPAPVDWCSEWASWVIRSVTALDTPTGSFGSGSMIEFFRERDRFAGPTDHRGHFLHLGAFVMGGFYVAVRSGGHSTMFVSWWSRNSLEGHRVPFQTASKVMSFLSIGGNQTRGRVSLDIQTVSDTRAFDASIDWWRRNLNGIDQEGFGDTIRKQPSDDFPWLKNDR